MALWIWGLISWAAITTLAVLYLAVVCRQRRRRSTDPEPMLEDGSVPGFVVEALPAQQPLDSTSQPAGTMTLPLLGFPPGATQAERPSGAEPRRVLDRLVAGARSGDYTLPPRLLDAHRAARLLGELDLPAPVPFGRDDAAAHLVGAAMDGRPLDPMGLCAETHRSRTDRLLHQEAIELLRGATRRAQDGAVCEATEACDRIITEHLRPAYREVLQQAREVARRLGPCIDDQFRPDTARIITASLRIRNAYLALPELVRRHSAILAARDLANALGDRTPQGDAQGLFAVLERPPADRPLPADDTARLLWLVSDEAQEWNPWLPTVAEQDASWRAHVGRTVAVGPPAPSA
jgi:hypothetical protein